MTLEEGDMMMVPSYGEYCAYVDRMVAAGVAVEAFTVGAWRSLSDAHKVLIGVAMGRMAVTA